MPNKVGEQGYSLPVMMYEKDIDIFIATRTDSISPLF